MARLAFDHPKKVAIGSAARDARIRKRAVRRSARKLALHGRRGWCAVLDDQGQVERVLRNLVSNALKYSPEGGAVRISAAECARGEVELCVQDHGLGSPSEWLDRLFVRFQRVERPERAAIRGVGLGLYIARQLVELNSGRIWATSDGIGRGAAFHFTLPRAAVRT